MLKACADLNIAVRGAQEKGYAESDPRLDLDGTDAAQKLIILARRAFGVSLPFKAIKRAGIEAVDPQWIRRARENERTTRLVAIKR